MAVNWVDRVPTRANRVLVTPENGGTPYYATITRADEPSVVGTPVNAANLNAMQNAAGLTTHKYVYVAPTGSDTSGDGSQTAPYATISKAVSVIPHNLNGYTARIYIAAGTYDERVEIHHFGNGLFLLTGTAGDVVNITSLEINNVALLEINNITINLPNAYLHVLASNVRIMSPFNAGNAVYGIYATYFTSIVCTKQITISNTTNYGIVATSTSKIYIAELLGSGNKMTVASTLGGVCVLGKDSSTTSGTQYFTDTGGRIYGGSQTQIPSH